MKKTVALIIISCAVILSIAPSCLQRRERIVISGHVYLAPAQGGGSVSPAEGAKITVSTDVNGNGRISFNERATTTADSNGYYSVKAPVGTGLTTVVRFSQDGYAALLRTVMVKAVKNIDNCDGTLVEMDDLSSNQANKWRNQVGSVEINYKNIGSGRVRHFNPATEADKFPGSFSDNKGNMLVSGVFTAFELQATDGTPLTTTASGNPARIRMRMPRDTWGAVVDTTPGTDRIDVPMFYFNEETGQWVRGTTEQGGDLSGWLERDNGTIIAESQLAAVRAGTFTGSIFAASDVTHFSYWNVDWPVESHACISGTVVDADGNPVAGATINVQGVTYTGTSSPQTTDEDGKFCVDVMRSEGPGEDVNQNGVTGEKQKVLIAGTSGGKLYNFGEHEIPVQSGTCPVDCLAVEVKVAPENEVQVTLCALTGTATVEGAPKAGILVYANDDLIDPDTWDGVCGSSCMPVASTDDTGAFSITAPFALKLGLNGYYSYVEETVDPNGTFFYQASTALMGCPASPVNLNLELVWCFVNSPAISVSGNTISISPNIPLTAVIVNGIMDTKWIIFSTTESGFSGPITYGTVPSGAAQSLPLLNAAPQALTTGDTIMVYPLGGTVPYQGRQCYSNSTYTVP